MTDWRETGRQIYERQVLERQERHAKRTAVKRSPDADLFGALLLSSLGNSALLVEYLRSGRKLSLAAESRRHLARVIEHQNRKPKVGRKINKTARYLALGAIAFYREWKVANQNAGISNWGLRNDMRDESCRYVLELHGWTASYETVRELMDRPKSRRNSK